MGSGRIRPPLSPWEDQTPLSPWKDQTPCLPGRIRHPCLSGRFRPPVSLGGPDPPVSPGGSDPIVSPGGSNPPVSLGGSGSLSPREVQTPCLPRRIRPPTFTGGSYPPVFPVGSGPLSPQEDQTPLSPWEVQTHLSPLGGLDPPPLSQFYILIFFTWAIRPRGRSCNEVIPMWRSKPEQQDQVTSPGTTLPTLCERCMCGFFNLPCYYHGVLKMQTGTRWRRGLQFFVLIQED